MIAAIPAGVSLLASGGDASTAIKIAATGAAVGSMIGPDGDEMASNIAQNVSEFRKAGRTYEEQKEVDAKKKVKEMKNDRKQMDELDKLLYKKGENISAEEWLDNNKEYAQEYAKGKIKNVSTMYKAQKLAESDSGKGLSKDYMLNLARQYENIGKRINDPQFMQAFDEQLSKDGVNQNDRNTLYQNLRFMEDKF